MFTIFLHKEKPKIPIPDTEIHRNPIFFFFSFFTTVSLSVSDTIVSSTFSDTTETGDLSYFSLKQSNVRGPKVVLFSFIILFVNVPFVDSLRTRFYQRQTANDMVGSKSMPDSWFIDGNFNGISEEFFDDVVECLDFPLEDFEGNVGGEDWNTRLQSLEPPSMDILASFSSGYCGRMGNITSKPDQNLSISYERTQIKQEPNSANTTSSISIPLNDDYSDVKHMHLFKTSSPVSILESSSSCFVENPKTDGPKFAPVKRARSKRSRPSSIKRQFALPFVSPTSSASENLYIPAASESDSETYLTDEMFKAAKRKQNRKKNLLPLSGVERGNLSSSSQEPRETKKCMHCEVTSTPQWREGPMGPKTLCNACGVRYRSGRLFPEYRPAASPTFIPSVHSNSHRKVVEMRSKASQGSARIAAMGTLSSVQPGNRLDSLII